MKIIIFYLISVKKWKQTNGIVLESNIEWFRSKNDSDTEGWKEKIIYKYNVDSQDYENDCISKNLGFLAPFKKWVNNHNYEKNQEVLIYYNPKNPKDSIIDKNINIFSILFPLLFFVFIFTVIYPNL